LSIQFIVNNILGETMIISRESLEIMLDLIEIKVNALQIHDKDDAREVNKLRKCKQELISLLGELNETSPPPQTPLKIETKNPRPL
jgi:hypothetical protein